MNSDLNPEAPEFHPHLKSVAKDGYTTVHKTIKTSNVLPKGASREMFDTYTTFRVVKSHLSENVVEQSNAIVVNELPSIKLKNNVEYNTDKIIDVNDSMLDRVNVNIDTASGVNKANKKFLEGTKIANTKVLTNKPIIAKIKMGSTTLIGAKNIPRPQLSFKDPIDNSESLWVPKISDKPNNIKPLALNILYNDEGEAIGYEHPYKVELDLYHPCAEFIDPDPEAPPFPPLLEETRLTYVKTEAQIDDLVRHLNSVKELAVDVEHHSYRTYQGITCLVQISTNEGGDFIIDALATREHLHKLNLIFTNPKKLKVFHGADCDVLWLQRDFGIYIVGLFDTHQAARTLKQSGLSLKKLLMIYCKVNTDKKYQLADWRMRPLPDELIEYARMDTHYLLYIWRQMKQQLLEANAGQPQLLMSVFEQSRQICATTYNKTVIHDESHMPLYYRSKKTFNSMQMYALQMLYKWRDAQARQLDESTVYLLPNHMLMSLAETLPREIQGINALCTPMPPFVRQNLTTIHRMMLTCRELPLEPQLYQMPAPVRNMANHRPIIAYNVHDFTQYNEFSDDQHSFEAVSLVATELTFQPDIPAFKATKNNTYCGIVSDLNVDAKMFIPPYDRYRMYRSIAQIEEIKEFKNKEAKIVARGQGDELIKTEVLAKLQQAKIQLENEGAKIKVNKANEVINEEPQEIKVKQAQRKRKMSTEKTERRELQIVEETKRKDQDKEDITKKELKQNNVTKSEIKNNSKPQVLYKNVNYKKFFNENATDKTWAKMKLKKHK